MATSTLLRVASCQLRLLMSLRCTALGVSLQHPEPCMTSVTFVTQRCCHDDSKRPKPSKGKPLTTSRRTTHTTKAKSTAVHGPAVDLLEKELQSLVLEKQRKHRGHGPDPQPRSTLQRRLDLLLSLGCTMDQIQYKVKVLDLSEQAILQRATMLKTIGRFPVTVNLLLSSRAYSQELVRKQVQRREELDSATCQVLQCSHEELDRLKADHPSLNRFRCLTGPDILHKSEVLASYGITAEQIKAFPAVLNVKVDNMVQRLDTLKTLRAEGKLTFDLYPLKTVSMRTRDFDKVVRNAVLGRAEVDGSRITHATIAQRLGVTAADIEDASINFHKLGPSSVLRKIDYLLGEGLASGDIVSHIYMMKYRLQVLKDAVERAKAVVVSPPPPIYIILSFLRSGRLPKKSFVWSRHRTYVASLLGVQSCQLPRCPSLRPLWSSDRVSIKRNVDFLTDQGFSLEDLLSCPLVLAHDPRHLQRYLQDLWTRPELLPHHHHHPAAWQDKRRVLSLLQYVIEKDMNFTSAVFHAEVEVDPNPDPESDLDPDCDPEP